MSAATIQRPADWKNYEDFASGIATNRLPTSDALVGKKFSITLKNGGQLEFTCNQKHTVAWSEPKPASSEWYEAILVAPDVYFLDMTFTARPKEALTLVINLKTRRVLSIRSIVREADACPGEPRVAQEFLPGVLANSTVPAGTPSTPAVGPLGWGSQEPAPTRDLIGLRAFYTYSPEHTYEHVYLSSERYCWQCLVGVQRGHGDVDMATTYKFDEGQYVFTFREFIIPVASVFFYNFPERRSTGKFLGVTAAGTIENKPAGAFIEKASMTFYRKDQEPV